jgi:hypothetical protein
MEKRRAGVMVVRLCAMALAAVVLAGCASGGYSDYDYYPAERYYDGPFHPYYGGFGFGSHYDDGSYYDDDDDRYDHPSRNVSCDRARDICYDRYGPSYHATKRYLGEREANRAYKKYGDSVFLFSPRPGVSCDRRTKECSDGERADRRDPMKRLERRNKGSVDTGAGFDNDEKPVRRVAPAQRSDDEAAPTKRIKPRRDPSPPPMADNDNDKGNDVARPSRRVQSEQPKARPGQNSNDKVRDGGAGNGCPPRGCTD